MIAVGRFRDAGTNPVVGGRTRNEERTDRTVGANHRTSTHARTAIHRAAPASGGSSVTEPLPYGYIVANDSSARKRIQGSSRDQT